MSDKKSAFVFTTRYKCTTMLKVKFIQNITKRFFLNFLQIFFVEGQCGGYALSASLCWVFPLENLATVSRK
jgi:hypothetical protein